jgi:hypothetical protein
VIVEALSIIISLLGAQKARTIYNATEEQSLAMAYDGTHNFYKRIAIAGFSLTLY